MMAPESTAMQKVTFFFPYYEVSGVPMLFSRIAAHLGASGRTVRVVDYPDGAMAVRLRGARGVELVPFADGRPLSIAADEVLVLQAILPYCLRPELRIATTTKLLFWTLHPGCLLQTAIPHPALRDLQLRSQHFHVIASAVTMPLLQGRLRRFVEDLVHRQALLFMDGETLAITRDRLRAAIPHPRFVPVPCDPAQGNRYLASARSHAGERVVGWLGRLSDFKIHILIHTLQRLSRFTRLRGMRVTFVVIGDGPEAHRIDIDGLQHECFRIEMAGVVTGAALEGRLGSLDLLTAMGTSALEGARLGVPTVLLDISHSPVHGDYLFRWLHDTHDFILGEILQKRHMTTGNDSLERIMDSLSERWRELSTRTYNYFQANHSLEVVSTQVWAAAAQTGYTYGNIDQRLLRKSFSRRLYEFLRGVLQKRRPLARGLP